MNLNRRYPCAGPYKTYGVVIFSGIIFSLQILFAIYVVVAH
jgi:hypothetical protein